MNSKIKSIEITIVYIENNGKEINYYYDVKTAQWSYEIFSPHITRKELADSNVPLVVLQQVRGSALKRNLPN